MPVTVQYPLQVPAELLSAEPAAQTIDSAVLRRGLLLPFRRDRRNDFANGVGVEKIKSNVRMILGTMQGEIPWLPSFGSQLHRLRHQNNSPILENLAFIYVVDPLRIWEPRARVTRVEVTREPRRLLISPSFDAVDTTGAGATITLASNLSTTIPLSLAA
jgi:phage baseplate assembly protein W